jgi:hypothetical protein
MLAKDKDKRQILSDANWEKLLPQHVLRETNALQEKYYKNVNPYPLIAKDDGKCHPDEYIY